MQNTMAFKLQMKLVQFVLKWTIQHFGTNSLLSLHVYVLFIIKPHMIEITDVVKASVSLPNEISGYFSS